MALRYVSRLDDSHFSAALRRMETGAVAAGSKIGRAFSGLGGVGSALGIGALGAAAASAVDRLSALRDAAASVDIPVEEYQRAAFALSQGGTKAEEARKGIANLSDALVEARDPASKAAKALFDLGVNLQDLNAADPVATFSTLAEAVKNSSDRAQAFSAISDLIGSKLAVKLLPSLAEGGAKFREMAASARVASEAMVEFADNLGDERKKAIDNFSNAILNSLYLTGKMGNQAFKKGLAEGGGFTATLKSMLAPLLAPFDPDAAQRLAGNNPAFDPEQLARDNERYNAAATQRAAQEKAVNDASLKSYADRLDKQEQLRNKSNEAAQDDARKMAEEEEQNAQKIADAYNQSFINRLDQQEQLRAKSAEAFEESIRQADMEAEKTGLEAKLKAAEDAQAAAMSRLSGAEQALSDFNRMGPDERRQANRDALDEKRFKAREERMEDKVGARAGDKRLADDIKNQKVIAEFTAAQIKEITDSIGALMPK